MKIYAIWILNLYCFYDCSWKKILTRLGSLDQIDGFKAFLPRPIFRVLLVLLPYSDICHVFCRVQALILSPTRELAAQTEKTVLAIGNYINIQAHACIGGKSVGEDIRKLEYGVQVVSGTPGRVCDMIKRRTLRTRAIKLLILVSYFLCFDDVSRLNAYIYVYNSITCSYAYAYIYIYILITPFVSKYKITCLDKIRRQVILYLGTKVV